MKWTGAILIIIAVLLGSLSPLLRLCGGVRNLAPSPAATASSIVDVTSDILSPLQAIASAARPLAGQFAAQRHTAPDGDTAALLPSGFRLSSPCQAPFGMLRALVAAAATGLAFCCGRVLSPPGAGIAITFLLAYLTVLHRRSLPGEALIVYYLFGKPGAFACRVFYFRSPL